MNTMVNNCQLFPVAFSSGGLFFSNTSNGDNVYLLYHFHDNGSSHQTMHYNKTGPHQTSDADATGNVRISQMYRLRLNFKLTSLVTELNATYNYVYGSA